MSGNITGHDDIENGAPGSVISWADFESVRIVVGTVTRVEAFAQARQPAWKVWVDFGRYGEKKPARKSWRFTAPQIWSGARL